MNTILTKYATFGGEKYALPQNMQLLVVKNMQF